MNKALWVLPALVLGAPISWVVSDEIEQRNAFCVSCHLSEGEPLHELKGADFRATPPLNLAAAHRAAEADFRCIQCHGGASFVNKLRVKSVAARDAALYLIGQFEEPTDMKHPLWDEDCAQCHETYDPQAPEDFHALADHNVPAFEYRCVDCHRAHPTDGLPQFGFLDREHVLAICRNCHEEF